jgi:hypothetical protein
VRRDHSQAKIAAISESAARDHTIIAAANIPALHRWIADDNVTGLPMAAWPAEKIDQSISGGDRSSTWTWMVRSAGPIHFTRSDAFDPEFWSFTTVHRTITIIDGNRGAEK